MCQVFKCTNSYNVPNYNVPGIPTCKKLAQERPDLSSKSYILDSRKVRECIKVGSFKHTDIYRHMETHYRNTLRKAYYWQVKRPFSA